MPVKFLKPKVIKLLAVAAVSFLLLFLNPGGFFNPIRKALVNVAYPFQKTFYLIGGFFSNSGEFVSSISEMKKENERLLKENNRQAAEIAALGDAKKENDSLREQLDLAPRGKFDLAASFVIGQNPDQPGSWIMIDKGSSQGIQPGMPVVVYEGILIGKVQEVFLNSSKVSLLSEANSAVGVTEAETGAKGILKGEYGLGVVMDMVSQTDVLNVGDSVITSGLDGNMPRGLLIGKIQEVKYSEDKLFQQAVVVPRIKYSKLETVFVVKGKK